MKALISMLTMKIMKGHPFDEASYDGKQWYHYKDKYGQKWVASHPYYPFKFRIKVGPKPIER